jgi:hypothetical protein
MTTYPTRQKAEYRYETATEAKHTSSGRIIAFISDEHHTRLLFHWFEIFLVFSINIPYIQYFPDND